MRHQAISIGCILAIFGVNSVQAQTPIPIATINRSETIDFEQEILPIFKRSCLACHNKAEANGSLVLETPATILKGGDSGPGVIAKDGAGSLLLKVAAHQTEPVMPPADNDVGAKALTTQELGLLKVWIDQGATGIIRNVNSPKNWQPLPSKITPIYATAITRDGQFAACGRANQIFIYHVPTGQLITRLTDPALLQESADPRPGVAHRDLVQSLSFNRAGDLLASGGFRTVKLWRRPRDVRPLELTATESVSAVAVSPDGTLLATAAADNTIQLWNRETGKTVFTFSGHTAAISALEFLPDQSKLVSASVDKTIRFWNLSEGSAAGKIETPSEINDLTLFQNGREMATAHADNFARHWATPGGLLDQPSEILEKALVLAVSKDGQFVASADDSGMIRVTDAGCGQLLNISWQAHEGPVVALSFSAKTSQLVSAGEDGVISVWDYETGTQLGRPILGTLGKLTSVALRADGKEVTTGTADGKISVWNLETPSAKQFVALPGELKTAATESIAETTTEAEETTETIPSLSLNGIPAATVAVSPDGKLLAASGEVHGRPAILIRDLTTGELKHTLTGHNSAITSLVFTANSLQLLSGSDDGTARLWDFSDEKFPELSVFGKAGTAVTGVAINADGSRVATCSADQTATLWDTATGEQIQSFVGHTAPLVGITIAPTSQQVITAAADKTIRVWNVADGKIVRTITASAAISRFASKPDASIVAVSLADNSILLYNTATGALTQTLVGHTEKIQALSFSKDGTRLLVADQQRAIIWGTDDGRLLEILPSTLSDPGEITSAVYGTTLNDVILAHADTGITQQTLQFNRALGDLTAVVTQAVYMTDGSVCTSSADGTIRRFTPVNGNQIFSANHGAPVHDLALSPDGAVLASAGEDQFVKLWTSSNGAAQPNPQLAGFQGAVKQIEFSQDGSRLVAADASGEIRVFHFVSRTLEQVHQEHSQAVQALICTDSQPPVVISVDGVANQNWELLQYRKIAGHSMPVTSIAAIHTTPPQILTGSLDGTVRHWNLQNGLVFRTMNHGAPVTDVAVRPDGQRFASSAEDNTARLWNATNGASVAILKGDIRALNDLARAEQELSLATSKVTATQETLTAATTDAPLKTAAAKAASDAVTAANTAVTAAEAALKTATATKAAAEQKAVVAAAAAQTATDAKLAADQLMEIAMAEAVRATDRLTKARTVAQAAPENPTLAAAVKTAELAATTATAKAKTATTAATTADTAAKQAATVAAATAQQAVATGPPYLTALTTLREAKVTQNTASQASALATAEAKKATDALPLLQAELKSAQERMTALTTKVETAKVTVAAAEKPIRTLAFSPDNRLLASGGDSTAVHTWSAETGRAVASFHGHTGTIQALLFTGSAELFSGATDKAAYVWNAEPGWTLERTIGSIDDPATIADRVMDLDFNADASQIAVGGGVASRSGQVSIFNVADGTLVKSLTEPHTDGVFGVSFSPDGSRLATCSADKYVKVFDSGSGKLVQSCEGHTGYVLEVAWRGDGRFLASCGADNTIRIWNSLTGELTRTIPTAEKQVTDIAFVGDTINTVSSSGDKTVRLHRSDNGQNLRTFPGSTDYMYAVGATPDSQFIIAGGFDGVLRVWNGTNGQVIHELASPDTKPATETIAEQSP